MNLRKIYFHFVAGISRFEMEVGQCTSIILSSRGFAVICDRFLILKVFVGMFLVVAMKPKRFRTQGASKNIFTKVHTQMLKKKIAFQLLFVIKKDRYSSTLFRSPLRRVAWGQWGHLNAAI